MYLGRVCERVMLHNTYKPTLFHKKAIRLKTKKATHFYVPITYYTEFDIPVQNRDLMIASGRQSKEIMICGVMGGWVRVMV